MSLDAFVPVWAAGPLKHFVDTPMLCWGAGPTLSSIFGFFSVCFFCEWVTAQPWADTYFIVYGREGDRRKEQQKTQSVVSWWNQLKLTTWTVAGPLNILSAVFNAYVFPLVVPAPKTLLPTWQEFFLHFLFLALVADFGLYWGHRIQHEVAYLWKNCHSVHHKLQTPTSVSTAYIEGRDAIIQAGLPIIASGLIVRPHPVTYCLYTAFHLGNNAWNHSGLDGWIINLLSLKCLPLRCTNRLHDAHHRFSGYGKGAKNFAEMFWLWDYVFGTYSRTGEILGRRQQAAVPDLPYRRVS